jgi:hypothetical protein
MVHILNVVQQCSAYAQESTPIVPQVPDWQQLFLVEIEELYQNASH